MPIDLGKPLPGTRNLAAEHQHNQQRKNIKRIVKEQMRGYHSNGLNGTRAQQRRAKQRAKQEAKNVI